MNDEVVYKAQEKAKLVEFNNKNGGWLIAGGLGLLTLTLSGVHLLDLFAPLLFISGIGVLMMWPTHKATADSPTSFSWLAGPGAFMVLMGALVFVANLTRHEELFAYAWTLFPIAFTGGMIYAKRFDDSHPIHERGRKVIRFFGWMFVAFGLFFELLVFESLGPWWPLAIVAYGIYMTRRNKQVETAPA